MNRCLSYLFLFGFFWGSFYAQPSEVSFQLPESWRLEKDLEQFHQKTQTLYERMIPLEQLNQHLQTTLKTLNQTPNSLELSRANKELSLSLNSFIQQTEQLIQSYEWLATQHQLLETRLKTHLTKIEDEQNQALRQITQIRQELLNLRLKEQAILQDYRHTHNVQTRNYLKQLFLIDSKNVKAKQFVLDQQEQKLQNLRYFQSQFSDLAKAFQPMKDSFQQLIQSLQEEKNYVLDIARFQIDLLQNKTLLNSIQQSRQKIHILEHSLSVQLDTYSRTREQLEEQMSLLRQEAPVSEPAFSKSDTLNFISPK